MPPQFAYLGPRFDHKDSLERLLQEFGRPLISIPDFGTWLASRDDAQQKSASSPLRRITSQLFGTSDPQYLAESLQLLDENKVTHVLAYWGTLPLPDIKALERLRPQIKFVLNVLCHPLGLTKSRVFLQNRIMAQSVSCLHGLVVSNTEMKTYLNEHIPATRNVPTLLLPPCWCAEYGPRNALPPTGERPNVLFLGRMDWKRGQPTDNVTEQLRALMAQHIDVHFSQSKESDLQSEYAHPFSPVPIRDLADLAAPFDASLILYNLSEAEVTDRFDTTVPDRVITSASIGIPIAIPSKGYAAIHQYLRSHRGVIQYDSLEHLADQLRDRSRIDAMRTRTRTQGNEYHAERHLPNLLSFLETL